PPIPRPRPRPRRRSTGFSNVRSGRRPAEISSRGRCTPRTRRSGSPSIRSTPPPWIPATAAALSPWAPRCTTPAARPPPPLGPHVFAETPDAPLTAVLRVGTGTDPVLAADYPYALARETNRRIGHGGRIPEPVLAGLAAAAAAENAQLRAATTPAALRAMAEVLADSDQVRYLTPPLQREMFAEMRWPGDDLSDGIDTRSLELAPDERAAMQIGRRADVMAQLHSWSAGAALGDYARDRVGSSSAVVAVTF